MDDRAVSTVVGATSLVVTTVLLASVVSGAVLDMADFTDEEERIDSVTNGTATPTPAAGA